ncbi:MAG TPA: AprI/Inh family metalloprotease inhibitor [Xanthobacteraceae bacterium]|nr:AprI/Inh family metalloprotease inhibitor [Xanthobacteraceae bacterium]
MAWLRNVLQGSLVTMFAIGVAGCRTDGLPSLTGAGATGPASEARPAPPPLNMAGRWMLAQPGRGQCSMNFRAASPTDAEGTIAPEGGCPGKFFTSRKWTFDSTGLSIRDHNGQPLAQLSSAAGVRFDGKATTGDPVTLTR